ncbi:NFACT family protein [Lysinibacillus sp. MHQ-1]|nr:NFACT family protein [Lysinibacillus sp. MHQ-1]
MINIQLVLCGGLKSECRCNKKKNTKVPRCLLSLERGIHMAFDGLFTYSITADLQQLVTGRITKIHQPNAQEVVLHVRANGKNHKLLFFYSFFLCTSASYGTND